MSIPAFKPDSFTYTDSPNPSWSYGQPVASSPVGKEWLKGEDEGWKLVNAETENPGSLYALMVSGIVPRPVAFVSSISEDGVENLSPFSWFNMVTHSPPVVSISFASKSPSSLKDTAQNIISNPSAGFTVNIISEPFVEGANATAVDAPAEVSEWGVSGLTKEASLKVKAARVKESAFSMECELLQSIPITHPETGISTTTLILGLVKYIHVRNDVLTPKGTVDPAKLKAVSRLGDISYARVGDAFRLGRPAWKDEGERILAEVGGRNGERN
ncbi:hypothetical protein JAAARDRAFT_525326 [Jaapia argillacea MUCL 33604]|uniref:Flavin reductase like domain-containing protein n=1 Tax=Jaapia argillacea MUCL 33604 TaxID=933084 RepID=A0A067QH12_9AGAM|nr:hypothetical protein JAAARDRAFT_525326 [Jaapia argillacea MUCL 33604]